MIQKTCFADKCVKRVDIGRICTDIRPKCTDNTHELSDIYLTSTDIRFVQLSFIYICMQLSQNMKLSIETLSKAETSSYNQER
jgi:hypothetical protein